MLRAIDLECVKGYNSLFKNISFSLHTSEILQIQGTNGSGKTSLLRILTGLSQPETGEIFWEDTNIDVDRESYLENLIYIGHTNGLKAELSALENLQLSRQYLGKSNGKTTQHALEEVGLAGYEHILAHQLSAGQKRRVTLARLALNAAPLWILDEPITAIDVDGINAFEKTIETHVLNGGMVILTTHQTLNFGEATTRSLSLT